MLSLDAVAPANAYRPRRADEELVYRVVAAELDGFLAAAEGRGHPLPSFVESTFRDFLTCGIPEHGFLRVHCDGCGRDRVVAFSCKRRGVCNSCGGRRMADTAAHLVDRVLPGVPTRQWVLSLPFPLRYRLAYDRSLATPLLAAFLRAVFASLRRRAHERYGVRRTKCGAVTFLQRFGGALNLNVHFHSLVLDGVYEVLPNSRGVRFLELPPPDMQEVLCVLADTVQRLVSTLERGGFASGGDSDGEDELSRDNPMMAALYAAAVQGRIAMGADAGQRVARLGNVALARDGVDEGSSRDSGTISRPPEHRRGGGGRLKLSGALDSP
jgi:ribosomal protein S27E